MEIEIVPATQEQRPIIERLAQLYEYDFSEWFGADVEADGLYRVMDLEAIWRPGGHVYLVKVDGHLAGFAFIDIQHQAIVGEGETNFVDEFFVMRKYRRRGVGRYVATTLFARFPGRWEVSELRSNVDAQAFWRTVIDRFTDGRFEEVEVESARWQGVVQCFESDRRSGPENSERTTG